MSVEGSGLSGNDLFCGDVVELGGWQVYFENDLDFLALMCPAVM